MARMFPNILNPDTDSRAEIQLFELFEKELPLAYHVFHSVAWQARTGRYGAKDGEADFVIIHPQLGILILEAKSGQISFEGSSGRWRQNNHDMGKDPFDQAKSSRYHLKRTLEENNYWKDRDIVFAHAVAFPDVVTPSYPLTLQSPQTVIFDQRNLQNPQAWIENVFAYYQGSATRNEIDQSGMKYLIDMLAPVRELHSLMGLDIQNEGAEIVRLTQSQYKVLDLLAWQSRAAIAGCAGSGKTMLAAEKARRLAEQGWRVLLTCYNVNLATFLREDYLADRPPTLQIQNFHKITLDLVLQSRLYSKPHFRSSEERQHYFAQELPEQLVAAVDKIGPQFDAIVVDEAQDFLEEWWLPLQMLLAEPDEGTFYLFYDDNQNIYGGLRNVKNLAQGFPLVENCRNTQRIHQLVQNFYQSEHPITALGPEGRNAEIIPYKEDVTFNKSLATVLHRLIKEEEIDPADIVILTPYSFERSALPKLTRLGNYRLTTNWDIEYNEVYYTTIHSFKGLESPVVILVEISETNTYIADELLYVGCSRAQNHLVIICKESIMAWFSHDK